jgi:hypothetical protein
MHGVPTGKALAADHGSPAPLAFASVTAVLRDVLANGLIRYSSVTRLEDVNVTVLPPDRITVGADEPNQINLFMYRVAPHSKLRSVAPSAAGTPSRRPPLAVDLHYLVTAYGAHDFHSEVLLGCAVFLLNSTPVLTSDVVRDALQRPLSGGQKGSALPPVRQALASSAIDPNLRLEVSQEFMAFEELSKLWSVMQARYRPTVTYRVSAVHMAVGE